MVHSVCYRLQYKWRFTVENTLFDITEIDEDFELKDVEFKIESFGGSNLVSETEHLTMLMVIQ